MDSYKKPVKIPARSAKTDKTQALYLFRRLNVNLTKDNRFKSIYCLAIP